MNSFKLSICSLLLLAATGVPVPVASQTRMLISENRNISAIMENANIRWVPITSASEAILKRPDPAGIENGRTIYVCRNIPSSQYTKPGKVWAADREIYCSVAHNGDEIRYNEFEMLEVPLGSTSWETYVGGNVPENAIGGGILGSGNLTYVCRAEYYGNILVGHFGHSEACFATFGHKEYGLPHNKEILVFNVYGQVL